MRGNPELITQTVLVLAAAAMMVLAGLKKHRLERRPAPKPSRHHKSRWARLKH